MLWRNGEGEQQILNRKIMMNSNQYGSTDITPSTKIIDIKTKLSMDNAFGSNLSLDPNDSQICLIARK